MRTALLVTIAVLALPATAAAVDDPAAGTPAWHAREQQNFQAAQQRSADRAGGPAAGDLTGDPLRDLERWAPARGAVLRQRVPNRYGARLAVTLLRPRGASARPLPTVVVAPGAGNPQRTMHWLAEDLAEHGYLVALFDPQGQGASDATPPDPAFCAPGAWQRPQEMGIAEQGSCAGRSPLALDLLASAGVLLNVLTGSPLDHAGIGQTYRALEPPFVFGILDVVGWLRSPDNPWRAWVDGNRIGAAGHSLGAYAAAQAANGDPRRRLRAAVALDAFHPLDHGVVATVPTLWLQSEQELVQRLAPPSDPLTFHPTRASVADARRRRVPSGLLVLRASTHQEFVDGDLPASRNGQRIAAYEAIAWLDRFLKGDRTGSERLFSDVFHGTVDRSSIGTGPRDESGTPRPIRIAGERRSEQLSLYFPSELAAFGGDCRDLRRVACPRPAAWLAAAVVQRSGRRLTVALRLTRGDVPPARVWLTAGGRTVGRAAGPVELDPGAEVRVDLRLTRRARARATLRVEAAGLAVRRRVQIG